jgi:hypothetical protein
MATVLGVSNQVQAETDTAFVAERRRWAVSNLYCYALLFLAIALFAGIRFHLRQVPLERDEGEYAYMGQLMLDGVPPYKIAANMKLPGTYAAYAAMMALFGQTTEGIHIGMIAVTTLCAIFVFLLGRHLYGTLTGAVAGTSYVFVAARPAALALCGHATHFVVLFALPGILLLLYAIDQRQSNDKQDRSDQLDLKKTGLFFASGLCFGLSFLMKQPGILFGVFAAFYWLYRERKLPWRILAIRGIAFATGTLTPFAFTCLVMLGAGVFSNFWFWTFSYAREYGSINSLSDGWRFLNIALRWEVRPFVLWTLVGIALVSPLWSRWARARAGFVSSFFFFSCVAVSIGLYFRPHYFILFMPAAALCMGIAVECLQRDLQRLQFGRWSLLPVAFFLAAYVVSVRGQWNSFYRLDPITLSRKMYYQSQAFPEDVKVAEFIKARSSPQDQIGIIGSEPEICFYTHLRCASSYLYMYPLLEQQKYARQMQAEFLQELQNARPRFLVYVDDEHSWSWVPTLEENRQFLDRAWNFAHDGYKLVDRVPAPVVSIYDQYYLRQERAMFYVFERTVN